MRSKEPEQPINYPELHRDLLELMKDIDKICTQEGISFMLHRGTLLGAIREKGFIEWDDDADLVMHRRDFDAFEQCCPRYLPAMGLSYENKGKFPMVIRNDKPECFAEIVTLDTIPASYLKHKIQIFMLLLLPLMLKDTSGYREYESRSRQVLVLIGSWIGRLFSEATKLKIYDRFCTWGNQDDSDFLFISNGAMQFINLKIKKSIMATTVRVPFAGTEMPVPVGYDEFLKMYYGDYMTPRKENYYA